MLREDEPVSSSSPPELAGDELRSQAQRARRLAKAINDVPACRRLRSLAAEYDYKADQAERFADASLIRPPM